MNIFEKIKVQQPGHSTFDMSYDNKLSLKMGKLVPVHLQEVLPGDHFRMSSEAMFRMMPMIAPIMHKVDIYFHSFFVPNRILWPNWERFITGGQPGSPEPAPPTMEHSQVDPSSLADYLGLPTSNGLIMEVSALPFAAYHRIWHEFYRDQNLQDVPPIVLQDGQLGTGTADWLELNKLRDRAWEHDYFTSALPFAQKGNAVELPVDFSNMSIQHRPISQTVSQFTPVIRNAAGSPVVGNLGSGLPHDPILSTNQFGSFGPGNAANNANTPASYDPQGTLIATGTAGTTINDLRSAYSLQRWLEKAARGGSRYIEQMKIMFGVTSSDKRLDRPEYLGGSKANMAISEVLQTSATDQAVSPQGNMAGHGISVSAGSDYSYSCEEHGYIMTILSIRPKTSYYQGLARHFWKRDRMEYYWPDFAMLGEQAIKNGEIFFTGQPRDAETFGYIPRYSEYRYNSARVAGQMQTTLEFWHMARKFDAITPPELNEDFITCDPTKRIFAVTDPNEDEIVAHIYHKIMARRPVPLYGTPGIF